MASKKTKQNRQDDIQRALEYQREIDRRFARGYSVGIGRDTFPIKEQLKELGCMWDPNRKVWLAPDDREWELADQLCQAQSPRRRRDVSAPDMDGEGQGGGGGEAQGEGQGGGGEGQGEGQGEAQGEGQGKASDATAAEGEETKEAAGQAKEPKPPQGDADDAPDGGEQGEGDATGGKPKGTPRGDVSDEMQAGAEQVARSMGQNAVKGPRVQVPTEVLLEMFVRSGVALHQAGFDVRAILEEALAGAEKGSEEVEADRIHAEAHGEECEHDKVIDPFTGGEVLYDGKVDDDLFDLPIHNINGDGKRWVN